MQSGNLGVAAGMLLFQSSETLLQMPLAGLSVRSGGHDGAQLFFEHPHHPGWSVSTPEIQLLEDASFQSEPSLRAQLDALRRVRPSRWTPWAAMVILAALVGAGVVWIFANKDRWVLAIANQIPASVEEKIGEQAIVSIQVRQKFLDDPELHQRLRAVTSRLLEGIDRKDIAFRFHIAADTNVNAFALPGGFVVVNTGLMASVKSPEELAGVLAHEIAHVTRRHGLRNMIQSAGAALLIQSFFGNLSGLEGVLVRGSQELLSQKYSRDFEREADETGWHYLLDAEIDPRGLIRFFKILKEQQGSFASLESSPLALLSTHPATDERIQSLEQRWSLVPKNVKFRPIGPP